MIVSWFFEGVICNFLVDGERLVIESFREVYLGEKLCFFFLDRFVF